MATIGFTYFDEVPTVTPPTTAELVASLGAGEKVAILDGYTNKVIPGVLKYQLPGVPKSTIVHLYKEIEAIEQYCKLVMRGGAIETEAIIEDGEITTPAVYYTVPTTESELYTVCAANFTESFTSGQVGAVVGRLVEYSKHDGTGDWAFYSANIIL